MSPAPSQGRVFHSALQHAGDLSALASLFRRLKLTFIQGPWREIIVFSRSEPISIPPDPHAM